MVLDVDGLHSRWRLPPPLAWMDALHADWRRQRAGDLLPDADRLLLSELAGRLPSLLLAHRQAGSDRLRVEFAGMAVRALLGENPVERCPEGLRGDQPLAWIGAGYASARHLMSPGAVQVRCGDRIALHLPYAGSDGDVVLIVTALGRWPGPVLLPEAPGCVVPLR